MYRLIYSILFCFSTLHSLSAEILNFQEVDSTTYRLYNEQQWDSVIKIGSEAIRQHIDYHYLRVRMGISFFNKKQYRRAIVHLQKALKYNSASQTALQYLYLSYLYSEQFEAAGKVAYRFDYSTAIIMKTNRHPIIDMVGVEAGEKKYGGDTSHLYGNASFANIIICHHIGKAISFIHAFSYYSQNFNQNYSDYSVSGSITQAEYYLGCNIPLGKGWLISPAVHFISLQVPSEVTYQFINQAQTPVNTIQTISSLAIRKSYPYFDIGIAGSYSYLYSQAHTQQTVSVNLYPLANNKLTIGGAVLANQDSLKTKTLFSYRASVSCVLFKRLRLCASYYQGNALYTNEYNGYLVNNCPDLTTSKITFSPSLALCKHIVIYVLIQSEQKTHLYPPSDNLPNVKFHYSTALAGIKIIM